MSTHDRDAWYKGVQVLFIHPNLMIHSSVFWVMTDCQWLTHSADIAPPDFYFTAPCTKVTCIGTLLHAIQSPLIIKFLCITFDVYKNSKPEEGRRERNCTPPDLPCVIFVQSLFPRTQQKQIKRKKKKKKKKIDTMMSVLLHDQKMAVTASRESLVS